jgi:hypothetical protein
MTSCSSFVTILSLSQVLCDMQVITVTTRLKAWTHIEAFELPGQTGVQNG